MPNVPGSILIYTDGACSGNPGPGGWASIVALPDGMIHEMGGAVPETTNNRMEMAAAIRALAMLSDMQEPPSDTILLYTDSSYLINGITKWIWGWRTRGWKSSDGKDVANRDLWEELLRQVTRLKPVAVEWKYVRGHNGSPGNERCDEIARAYSKNKKEPLYVGKVDGYFVDLSVLPAEDPAPEQKKSFGTGGSGNNGKSSSSGGGGGGGPVTYLSYRNGVVMRHSTWAACEKRVKGQPNVKFKKAKSPQEEREILRSWELDPSTKIE